MEISEAKSNIRLYGRKSMLTKEEEFVYIESLEFLIEATKDTEYMCELGGYYYENKKFDLALKYYEMADEAGDRWAAEGLGYIWYYGRTGERDYEKAFKYYSKAAENGNLRSSVKVADMYKNGYYVRKNKKKYRSILESLLPVAENTNRLGDPLPEVYTRLAAIYKEEGNLSGAAELYLNAKYFLRQRIVYTCFFGDLNIMSWLIEDLYGITEFDESNFDLYDLYYLLKTPHCVHFMYEGNEYEVTAETVDGQTAVKFRDKYYRGVKDFMAKASIGNKKLIELDRKLYAFEVVR